jgi:hypothetical protein
MKINIDTPRGAKEYLIARIAAEAYRQDVPLSEVEMKMLFLSKDGWTLPDMEQVHDAFERYHHIQEYEDKINGLIRSLCAHDRASDRKVWNHAVHVLGREDHYVLSLIAASGKRTHPLWELLKFLALSLVILGSSVAVAFYIHNHSK